MMDDMTPEREARMLAFWNRDPNNPPALDQITQYVFDDNTLDGRSPQGKAVRKALTKHNLRFRTSRGISEVELAEEHKEFIKNHLQTMSSIEITNELFKKGDGKLLSGITPEGRAVRRYILSLNVKTRAVDDDAVSEVYQAPANIDEALHRVNEYVDFIRDVKKINAGHKRGLSALIGYLKTNRFQRQINSYDNNTDRASFEDAFIRYTYDKADLTQEEVDEFIVLATEVVMGFSIQRRSEVLQRQLDRVTDGSEDSDPKISMGLVEAIGKAQGEYNQCVGRQQKLLQSLKQKRSDRISKAISDNASILNLVELWKNEETRKDMLKMADKEQKEIDIEVDRLKNTDDIRAKIFGFSENEARNG